MASYRIIKKQTFEDEKLASIPLGGRWLYAGLWCHADDNGIFRASTKWVKSRVFPYDDDLRLSEIQHWLDALAKARMIVPFNYRNEGYYVIRTFLDHQKIDKRFAKFIIPEIEATNILVGLYDDPEKMLTAEEKRSRREEEEIRREENGDAGEEVFLRKAKNQKKGNPPGSPPPPLVYPFDTDKFLCHWEMWKTYKKEQHKFTFKSTFTEQAALNDITNLSCGNEEMAIAIILQSMAKGWSGLFELKDKHGQANSGKTELNAAYKQYMAKKLQGASGSSINDNG